MSSRIIIAGTASASGKTSLSSALMSLLSHRYKVQPFKVGPDFIDPMYHSLMTGRLSRNLDGHMMGPDIMRAQFLRASADADISVIEGVRGLYEGKEALTDAASTAEAAKTLKAPVILVLDSMSITRSAAAMIMGFKAFDPDVNIAGVILNKVSGPSHLRKLKEAVEHYTDVELLGHVTRDREPLGRRHLGLDTVFHEDRMALRESLELMLEDVDVDRVAEIAASASDLQRSPYPAMDADGRGLRVAVPYDRAFCFYYPENLEAFEEAGTEVVRYSPVAGDPLPDADIHYLGGGYPELHGAELSSNKAFLQGLKDDWSEGKVIYAECGGMMTLCEHIIDLEGGVHPMAGIFPATASMRKRRQGPFYTVSHPIKEGWSKGTIKAHEFHYSGLDIHKEPEFVFKIERGMGIDGIHDGIIDGNAVGTYMHRHHLAQDGLVQCIIEKSMANSR